MTSLSRRALIGLGAALFAPAPKPTSHTERPPAVSNSWSNNGTTSLTLPTGAVTGARIVIDGAADAIYEYNAANRLTGVWAATAGTDPVDGFAYLAGFTQIDPSTGRTVGLALNGVVLRGPGDTTNGALFSGSTGSGGTLQALTGMESPSSGSEDSSITLYSTSADGTSIGAAAIVQQDNAVGTSIFGNIIQNDSGPFGTGPAAPKFMHTALYTGTVVGAGGLVTISHGATFTPTFGNFTATSRFSQGNWTDAFGTHGFTATQAQITAYTPAGAFVAAGTVIEFYAVFMA